MGVRSLSMTWARIPSTRSGVPSAAQDTRYSCSNTLSSGPSWRTRRMAASVTLRAVGDLALSVAAASLASVTPLTRSRSMISSTVSAA